MLPNECREQFGMFQSPVGQTSNRLLWGDWDKGEYGVLVRSLDIFDRPGEQEKVLKEVFEVEKSADPLQYLPASYLHASLRPPNAMFTENPESAVGVLVGTKYKKNWAMAGYQQSDSVDCNSYYPSDAGTLSRAVLEGADKCLPAQTIPLCVDNECLANEESACGGCSIAPDKMGDFVGRFMEKENRTEILLTFMMCDYPDVEDMVVASNALYKERSRWFEFGGDVGVTAYKGYTECLVSLNIKDFDVLDALVVPLYEFAEHKEHSMCEFELHPQLDEGLQKAWNYSYGDLPVLFYHESLGMHKNEDCIRHWGGRDCNEGWQKEFFSQEYHFDSNACIHRPPDCQEAYYFPPDGDECSAFTQAGEDRIKELCAKEKHMDAVLAAEMRDRASSSLRSGSITMLTGPQLGPQLPPSYQILYHGCFFLVCVTLSLFVRGRIVISVSKV